MANTIGSRKGDGDRKLKTVAVVAVFVALVGGTGWYAALHHPGLSWRLQSFLQAASSLLPFGLSKSDLTASLERSRLAGGSESGSEEELQGTDGSSALARRGGWIGSEGKAAGDSSLAKARKDAKNASLLAKLAAAKAKSLRDSKGRDFRSADAFLDRDPAYRGAGAARARGGSSRNRFLDYSKSWEIGPGGFPFVTLKGKKVPVMNPKGGPGNPLIPILPLPEEAKLSTGELNKITSIEADGNDQKRTVLGSNSARETYQGNYGATLAQCHEAALIPQTIPPGETPPQNQGEISEVADVRSDSSGVVLVTFKDGSKMSCLSTEPCGKLVAGDKVVLTAKPYGQFLEVVNVQGNPGERTTVTMEVNGAGNTGQTVRVECRGGLLCSGYSARAGQETHTLLQPAPVLYGSDIPSGEPTLNMTVASVREYDNGKLYRFRPTGMEYFATAASPVASLGVGDSVTGAFRAQCIQEVITAKKIITNDSGQTCAVFTFQSGQTVTCCKPYCVNELQVGDNAVVDSSVNNNNDSMAGMGH